MQYIKIKGLEKDISRLVFGTATPKLFAAVAPNATKQDEEAAFALLDTVFPQELTRLTVRRITAKKSWVDGWKLEITATSA